MKNTFTKHFKLKKQAYDFFDISIENDVTAFICPFLIENNKDFDIAKRVGSQVNSFLAILNRKYIKSNDRQNGIKFLSHLHEPNQYHLGYSSKNKGKAVSEPRSILIFDSLRSNRFSKQGLNITNEANNVLLLVKGIGQDIMSDIISNVCRDIFTEFTEKICKINNIPTQEFLIEYFDVKIENWNVKKVQLPVFDNKYIILVPKKIISGSREYSNLYNWFIAKNYIAIELLKQKSSPKINKFVIQLKDNTRKAIIKKIYKAYRKPKNELIEFVLRYKGSIDDFVRYAKEHYPALKIETLIR